MDQFEGTVVESSETLLRIVDALHESGEVGVTELATELGVAKSTVHKHLKTLEKHRYAVNDGGSYRPGFKFLSVGGKVRDNNELCTVVDPKLRELAERTDELVTFGVEEFGLGRFTFIYNDKYDIKEALPLGRQFYLHANAAGKAILSTYSDERIEAVLDRHGMKRRTENTITNPEELFEHVERIRDRGYALSIEERRAGMQAVSAAVTHPGTETVGAISLVGPTNRLTEEKLKNEYADAVLEIVNEIDIIMNYR